jgi:hypothetical protein
MNFASLINWQMGIGDVGKGFAALYRLPAIPLPTLHIQYTCFIEL